MEIVVEENWVEFRSYLMMVPKLDKRDGDFDVMVDVLMSVESTEWSACLYGVRRSKEWSRDSSIIIVVSKFNEP